MPVSLAVMFRAVLLVFMTGYVFLMYCIVRTLADTTGFHAGAFAVACLVSLALMVPLVWIFGLPELPEIYTVHLRAARRWAAQRCPQCGYSLKNLRAAQCPECGRAIGKPDGYRFTASTIRRFSIMIFSAWVLGCALGEFWSLDDEQDFAQEVRLRAAAGDDTPYARPRRWPSEGTRITYDPQAGIGPGK